MVTPILVPKVCVRVLGCVQGGGRGRGFAKWSPITSRRAENWQRRHYAYWQSPPSVKNTQGQKSWSWFQNAAGKPFPGTHIINGNTRLPAHVRWSKWSTQEAKGSFKCTMGSDALRGRCGRFFKQWILHGGSWLGLLSHRSRWQYKVHVTEGEIRLLTTAGTAESVHQTCSQQMRDDDSQWEIFCEQELLGEDNTQVNIPTLLEVLWNPPVVYLSGFSEPVVICNDFY